MIGGKPLNPHFNSKFLNQSCIKIVVGDSVVLPKFECKHYCCVMSGFGLAGYPGLAICRFCDKDLPM